MVDISPLTDGKFYNQYRVSNLEQIHYIEHNFKKMLEVVD